MRVHIVWRLVVFGGGVVVHCEVMPGVGILRKGGYFMVGCFFQGCKSGLVKKSETLQSMPNTCLEW